MSSKKSDVPSKTKTKPVPTPKPKPEPRTAEEEAVVQQWIHEHWETTDEVGNTPLHRAVLRQDTLYAMDLMNPTNVNAVNHRGKTPLQLAVQNPAASGLVQQLVLGGADVQSTLFSSHTDHIPYLLKKGASLDQRDSDNRTPFLHAVHKRDLLKANFLMDVAKGHDMEQALSIAEQNGDQDMMDILTFRSEGRMKMVVEGVHEPLVPNVVHLRDGNQDGRKGTDIVLKP